MQRSDPLPRRRSASKRVLRVASILSRREFLSNLYFPPQSRPSPRRANEGAAGAALRGVPEPRPAPPPGVHYASLRPSVARDEDAAGATSACKKLVCFHSSPPTTVHLLAFYMADTRLLEGYMCGCARTRRPARIKSAALLMAHTAAPAMPPCNTRLSLLKTHITHAR